MNSFIQFTKESHHGGVSKLSTIAQTKTLGKNPLALNYL